jgi:hypothetical protein
MTTLRYVAISMMGLVLCTSLCAAQDLSSYRDFRFGATLETIARQVGMTSSEARILYRRPALLEELEWRIRPPLDGSSAQADSVKLVVFSFFNSELFRIDVSYDRDRTAGMTDQDMIERISEKYGLAAKPPGRTIAFSSSQVYDDSEKVIACWEDARYSFNLFRSSYEHTFGMAAFSKKLDMLARSAVAKALHQDQQEAPQRVKREAENNRIAQEKARISNKTAFRP